MSALHDAARQALDDAGEQGDRLERLMAVLAPALDPYAAVIADQNRVAREAVDVADEIATARKDGAIAALRTLRTHTIASAIDTPPDATARLIAEAVASLADVVADSIERGETQP